MSYFDEIYDRFNSNSEKWSCAHDELPMWVADMDFKTAPKVIEAIAKKANSGIFGYARIPEEFFAAQISWWKDRHEVEFSRESMLFGRGVIAILASAMRKLTNAGDKILIQTPVYGTFFNVIRNNNRQIIENELIFKDGKYEIDFADFEKKIAENGVKMMILCNPHNPIGKRWNLSELNEIVRICEKYDVLIFSDEIHCDIAENSYVSLAKTASKNHIIAISPSKTFNLAGIHSATAIASNSHLQNALKHAFNDDEIAEANSFCVEATIAAYESADYVRDLNAYIAQNRRIAGEFIKNECKLSPILGDATYLLWVNLGEKNGDTFCDELRAKTGLWVSRGSGFGANGLNFFRLNLATPRIRLKDGLNRLKSFTS